MRDSEGTWQGGARDVCTAPLAREEMRRNRAYRQRCRRLSAELVVARGEAL